MHGAIVMVAQCSLPKKWGPGLTFSYYVQQFDFCGDGMINSDDSCDDGNDEDGDGCDRWCEINRLYL